MADAWLPVPPSAGQLCDVGCDEDNDVVTCKEMAKFVRSTTIRMSKQNTRDLMADVAPVIEFKTNRVYRCAAHAPAAAGIPGRCNHEPSCRD